MKYLRRVVGVTRKNRVRNTQIREDLEVISILDFIEQRQLCWWGPVSYTHLAYAVPLKSKMGKEVARALEPILSANKI